MVNVHAPVTYFGVTIKSKGSHQIDWKFHDRIRLCYHGTATFTHRLPCDLMRHVLKIRYLLPPLDNFAVSACLWRSQCALTLAILPRSLRTITKVILYLSLFVYYRFPCAGYATLMLSLRDWVRIVSEQKLASFRSLFRSLVPFSCVKPPNELFVVRGRNDDGDWKF